MLRKPLVLVAGLALAACGGTAFTADDNGPLPDSGTLPSMDAATPPIDGTAGEDVTTTDAGPPSIDTGAPADDAGVPANDTGAGVIPCPAALPTAQMTCAPEGRECEYGTSPVEECDSVATCTSGAWSITEPDSSGKDCPKSADMTTGCPATEDGARGACPTENGLICDYLRGDRCDCASNGGGITVISIDGGPITPTWHCQDPATGCPASRPNLGTACANDAMSCDYGSCGEVLGGTAEGCRDGVWQTEMVACPQ